MSLSSSLRPSRGFHFEYTVRISSIDGARQGCEYYFLFEFPRDVFVDPFELEDRHLSFKMHGDADLEKPVVAMSPEGLTLEVRLPPSNEVSLPVHARYPLPGDGSYSTVLIPQPRLYSACPSTRGTKGNPFSILRMAYSPWWDLSSWEIDFYNVPSRVDFHKIEVPAGSQADLAFVQFSTILVILLATFYLFRVLWKTTQRSVSLKTE